MFQKQWRKSVKFLRREPDRPAPAMTEVRLGLSRVGKTKEQLLDMVLERGRGKALEGFKPGSKITWFSL